MSGRGHVPVQYIGRATVKTDNILHRPNRIWKGYGAVQRVPESDYERYLAHPDEFRVLTPIFLESAAAEAMSTDEQIYALLSIAANLELHAAEELLVAVNERIKELREDAGSIPISADDRPRFNERKQKIASAIEQMDTEDPLHYTDLGKPRVNAVNRISGLGDVTSAEITEVVRVLKASEASKQEVETARNKAMNDARELLGDTAG